MSSDPSTSQRDQVDFLFGWDLLYKTVEHDIRAKNDVLVVLLHFMLIRHGSFKCCGIGEDKSLPAEGVDTCSEVLPEAWNTDNQKYALRYVLNKQLYLLLVYTSEDSLIVNFVDVTTRKITNIVFQPDTDVTKLRGKINELIPNCNLIAQRIKNELIEPMQGAPQRQLSPREPSQPREPSHPREPGQPQRQQQRPEPDRDPLRIYDPPRAPHGGQLPFGVVDPRFPEVGRSDLDPLGRIGPGNLFPFPSRPDIGGRDGRPRFDPFGPPDGLTSRDPNPDHFPPPGFGGNYYL